MIYPKRRRSIAGALDYRIAFRAGAGFIFGAVFMLVDKALFTNYAGSLIEKLIDFRFNHPIKDVPTIPPVLNQSCIA